VSNHCGEKYDIAAMVGTTRISIVRVEAWLGLTWVYI
jgi:hypothetical protein